MACVNASLKAVHSSLCRIVGSSAASVLLASAKIDAFDIDDELVQKLTAVFDIVLNCISMENGITRWSLDQTESGKESWIAGIRSKIAQGNDVSSLNVVPCDFLRFNLDAGDYDTKLNMFSTSFHGAGYDTTILIRTPGAGRVLQDATCHVGDVASVFFIVRDEQVNAGRISGCVVEIFCVGHNPAVRSLMAFLQSCPLTGLKEILVFLQGVDKLMLRRDRHRVVPVTLEEMYYTTNTNPESMSIRLSRDLSTRPEFWDNFFSLFFASVVRVAGPYHGFIPFDRLSRDNEIIYMASAQGKAKKIIIEVYKSNQDAGYFHILVPVIM